MPPEPFTLTVQNHRQERQIRRLGVATALLWRDLPPEFVDRIIKQAAAIQISGENSSEVSLQQQITVFLNTDAIKQ
jgi:hypothetical protein